MQEPTYNDVPMTRCCPIVLGIIANAEWVELVNTEPALTDAEAGSIFQHIARRLLRERG